jgi:type VI secretion system secreted protein Hcp
MPSDYLLELDGVKGESKDDFHRGSIELESWSLGASNPSANPEGANFREFHFTKKIDKSSPTLLLRCATGKHIPKAVLYGRRSSTDPAEYYKVTMSECLVSSFSAAGDGGDLAVDEFSLNFSQVEVVYTPTRGASVSTGVLADVGDDGGAGGP